METSREKAKPLPRCPKGTRRNKKTGECIPIKKPSLKISDEPLQQAEQSLEESLEEQVEEQQSDNQEQVQIPEEQQVEQQSEPIIIKKDILAFEAQESKDLLLSKEFEYLYPSLNDPNFNIKIAERKEFNDTRYDGEIVDAEKQSEILCNAEFELAPHQLFVRNFLSFQTPYNSLLLYHGLGSGKTCSAISVAEEMRDYLMQMGITNRIMVVASPNVQENFKLQLFNESKLKLVDGLWNIRACTGNKFLKEINPMNMKGLSRENVISQVKKIINSYYVFLGYIEFANYITKKSVISPTITDPKQRKIALRNKLRKHFSSRLIIIDEVHNIRITDDNSDKRVALELFKLVENVDNLRLLLLSATPMYNSYKEIIWLINLMNMNDRRPTIDVKDVFNPDGSFKTSKNGEPIGRELLERKATGYISFVRGENPYTFPFRIFPNEFEPEHTFQVLSHPTVQLNGKTIVQHLDVLSLYLVENGTYQQAGYDYVLQKMKEEAEKGKEIPNFENMEAFGYTMLQRPLEALNMIYPHSQLDTFLSDPNEKINVNVRELVGKEGLNRIMKFSESKQPLARYDYEYREDALEKYGKIFSPSEIGKYSSKIKNITQRIINSKGVVLIYSQYIDGGVLPIALALEELGFSRAGNVKSLLKDPSSPKIDALTMKPKSSEGAGEDAVEFHPAKYVMITGDKALSPNSVEDIKLLTSDDNKDGRKVKVVLISQAGSEGLDLKFIRQVHVLEPWYNMNRIEQIIGRAVRTCSHKDLPFKERNVEIYLYGSININNPSLEAADIYVYRLAELKALQIGNVSRLLKEIAVDCILNYEQTGFTIENMKQKVKLELSSNNKTLDYQIGDKPYSATCDYMEKCQYVCRPSKEINDENVKLDTYSETFIMMNTDKLIHKIRNLMKERYFYRKNELIKYINAVKFYPLVQINAALNQLVEDKNEYISDKYGRLGNLINIGDMYLFQPLELNNPNISVFERNVPLDYKHKTILYNLPEKSKEKQLLAEVSVEATTGKLIYSKEAEKLIEEMREKYNTANSEQTLSRGEDNWYKLCSKVISMFIKDNADNIGSNKSLLLDFVCGHCVDELSYDDAILLFKNIELISESEKYKTDEFIQKIKTYIFENMLSAKNMRGLLVNNEGKNILLVATSVEGTAGAEDTSKKWKIAESEDYNDFKDALEEQQNKFMPVKDKLNELIGFMNNFKKDYIVFKVKDMTKKRHKGARCDQSGKTEAIKMLNAILSKTNLGINLYDPSIEIVQKQVCVMQEFYLRYFNKQKINNKIWYLNPSQASLINIEKLSF